MGFFTDALRIVLKADMDNNSVAALEQSIESSPEFNPTWLGWLLYSAIKAKNTLAVRLLLTMDVDLELKDCSYSILQTAIIEYDDNKGREIFDLLLKATIDINGQNTRGEAPLHIAVISGRANIVRQLTAYETININIKRITGETPLHLAAIGNVIEIGKILLEKGAWVNARNNNQTTPLHLSAMKNQTDAFINMLLDYHADVTLVDDFQQTALYCAAAKNNASNVQTLIQHGADPYQKTTNTQRN